jgi:AraC-like DNA-binding protein
MVRYQEYAPCLSLQPYISCLWSLHAPPATGALADRGHQVLPDNGIDILWQNGAHASFAVGMMTAPIIVAPSLLTHTCAVRFKPGAASRFFDLPLDALSDQRASLSDLWGSGHAARIDDELWTHALSDRQRLDILERHLLLRLHDRRAAQGSAPNLVASAIAAIEASAGAARVDALAGALGVTRQHLGKQFRTQVGLSPKLFARICRFRHAMTMIRSAQPGRMDWAGLAPGLGYFDQAHLIHEFQEFSGATPESFAAIRRD